MKNTLAIIATIIVGLLASAQSSFAQIDLATPVPGTSMIHNFTGIGEDQNPYREGGNPPTRRGCILNECPEIISIDQFAFGNNSGSELRYVWTVKSPSVAAFSISTIEYDPFGNPLPRESWIIPIDDDGQSINIAARQAQFKAMSGGQIILDDPVSLAKAGFQLNSPYLSVFRGAGTSADLLEHITLESLLPEKLLKLIKPEILEKLSGKPTGEVHPMLLEGLLGRSTRFTVVTFVSHVRFTSGKVWDASIPYTIAYSWGFEQEDKRIETAALDSLLMYYGEHQPKP